MKKPDQQVLHFRSEIYAEDGKGKIIKEFRDLARWKSFSDLELEWLATLTDFAPNLSSVIHNEVVKVLADRASKHAEKPAKPKHRPKKKVTAKSTRILKKA